jgi:hydroxyethylthiazole kinase-like uncharacterized protein yjeF
MTLTHDEGLINLKMWHHLQKKYAISPSAPQIKLKQTFPYLVLDFIQQLHEPSQPMRIAVCCGDEQRFSEIFGFMQYASNLEWQLDIYLTPSIEKKWQEFVLKLAAVIPVFLNPHLLENNHYTFLLDCIAPIGNETLNLEHLEMLGCAQNLSIQKISLDIPSGLNPDTGDRRCDVIFRADMTLSRFAYFQGLFTGVAKEYSGICVILTPEWPMILDFTSYLLTEEKMLSLWPKRFAFAYKSDFKPVKVLAGQESMFGASVLAAYAALVMGAGWVEVYYQRGLTPPIGELPEIIWHPIDEVDELKTLITGEDILVIGPGLGFGVWGQSLWRLIKDLPNQMVVDASALDYLAQDQLKKNNWIITPHPGEAARLLNCSAQMVQSDRFCAINALTEQYHSTVVLKGSGTLISQRKYPVYICPLGNPGMATPGMGDTLTGLIAGCWAQMSHPLEAANLAVWLHASAGDKMMEKYPAMIVRPKKLIQELQNYMQDVLCKSNRI